MIPTDQLPHAPASWKSVPPTEHRCSLCGRKFTSTQRYNPGQPRYCPPHTGRDCRREGAKRTEARRKSKVDSGRKSSGAL